MSSDKKNLAKETIKLSKKLGKLTRKRLAVNSSCVGGTQVGDCGAGGSIIGGNTIVNSNLAMSQLGTVYATKRRRRNGKR